jgi:non-homologous end joining protein Ku
VYRLLVEAMEKSGRVALAQLVSYGQERLVLIRPCKGGLVLQVMFFANEVRDFNQIANAFSPATFGCFCALLHRQIRSTRTR